MKRAIFIFCIVFLCHDGFSKCFDESFSWELLCDTIFEKISTDMLIDNEFQSILGEDWFERSEFQFDALEVVFDSKDSIVVYSHSELELPTFKWNIKKLKTLNKITTFFRYIDEYNKLPKDKFQYLNYKFYVLNEEEEKLISVIYRLNGEIEIIGRTIVIEDSKLQ